MGMKGMGKRKIFWHSSFHFGNYFSMKLVICIYWK